MQRLLQPIIDLQTQLIAAQRPADPVRSAITRRQLHAVGRRLPSIPPDACGRDHVASTTQLQTDSWLDQLDRDVASVLLADEIEAQAELATVKALKEAGFDPLYIDRVDVVELDRARIRSGGRPLRSRSTPIAALPADANAAGFAVSVRCASRLSGEGQKESCQQG